MIKLVSILLVAMPLWANANEFENKSSADSFEINQKNCNLPMEKIRQQLPNRDDQKKALERCMEKAIQERWKLPKNPLTSK